MVIIHLWSCVSAHKTTWCHSPEEHSLYNLYVVLCGYETVLLGEEHRLRVCDNRVLRGIFSCKREEIT
jgi:hypothetical protein